MIIELGVHLFKKNTQNSEARTPFCPGRYSLNKSFAMNLHFKHLPSEYPRKAAVKFLKMQDLEEAIAQIDITDKYEGKIKNDYDFDYLDIDVQE